MWGDVAIRIPFTMQIIRNCTIGERIATPVCALVRNDIEIFTPSVDLYRSVA